MNLLGAKLYDPAGAVSKSCAALLALTAFDTTNLRIAFTVPAHGFVLVKLRCNLSGATTFPQVMLGVLEGSTVRGRQVAMAAIPGTALATTNVPLVAEFVVAGLTPGAVNWDAAYGVETLLAATNIHYGGPNDTTGNNAWGAFAFEVWDPRPIPTAAPGAADGLQIAGSNAATTYAAVTVSGATTLTGNVAAAAGVTITQSTTNGSGLAVTGNGTGQGFKFTNGGGATSNLP